MVVSCEHGIDDCHILATVAALQRSEARYRDLFENATDLIATVDLDDRITAVNRAFVRALGYTQDELIGKPLRDLVPSEWHERLARTGRDKIDTAPNATVYEHELLTKDGRRILVEVASRLVHEDGRPIGVQAICRDLSDRKRAEELERRLLDAQRLESIGRLAGGIAHDFNNLLTVISGYTEALLDREESASAPELAEIAAAAKRATTLTQQLLAFGQGQVLEPRVIDLNDIIVGLIPMLTQLIGENIELRATLDPRLSLVLADGSQVERILANLALNAHDAMPTGGQLTIETANVDLEGQFSEQAPEADLARCVMISVTDTGVGMRREEIAQIFEPFYTTKLFGGGTGLGLSTVHGIVTQSGGRIHVDSEPGRGSSFIIQLPVAQARPTSDVRTGEPGEAPIGTETILVVEDEQALRSLTVRMLKNRGYSVIAAENPLEAVRLIEEDDRIIDLLLTDLVMPQMDGYQLAKRVSEQTPNVRVLFMSGYANEEIMRGSDLDLKLLEKPFSAGDLARKIREVLDAPMNT